MLVHWTATYFFSFPLLTYHKQQQQQLLPYGNSEGTSHLIVLSGGSLLNHDVTIVRDL